MPDNSSNFYGRGEYPAGSEGTTPDHAAQYDASTQQKPAVAHDPTMQSDGYSTHMATHEYAEHMTKSQHHGHSHMLSHNPLSTVQQCASMCDHSITLLLCMPDVAMRFQQIQLLRDCAGICAETACSLAGQRPFAHKLVKLCAKVCEACAMECTRYPDPESQRCGAMCHRCAQECRAALGMYTQ